jgi:hypothetical protein
VIIRPAPRGREKFAESMLCFAIALRQRRASARLGAVPGGGDAGLNRIRYQYRSLLDVFAPEHATGAGEGLDQQPSVQIHRKPPAHYFSLAADQRQYL